MIKTIEKVKFQQLVKPQSFTTSTTVLYNGVAATTVGYIDTQDFNEVIIELNKGVFASGAITDFTVVNSAATDPSAATAVTGATFTQGTPSAHNAVEVMSLQCKDLLRYVWLKSDKSDDINAAAIWSATAILCGPDTVPTSATLVVADLP